MNNTPSGTKKHHKSTEPESCQMIKMFFFLSSSSSSSSSDGLVKKILWLFQVVFVQNSYTEQCTSQTGH